MNAGDKRPGEIQSLPSGLLEIVSYTTSAPQEVSAK